MEINKLFACNAISLLAVLFFASSCKKEIQKEIQNVPVVHPVNNKPPIAFAGNNTIIHLPTDSFILTGSYSTDNFDRAEWKQINGPACLIENKNTHTTKVKVLQAGNYHFELTVYDKLNLYAKDTVAVSVLPPGVTTTTNFLVFTYLTWIYPWYNALEVPSFYTYVQSGQAFKVFVQRGLSANWVEAKPVTANGTNLYEYFIETRPDGAGIYNFGSLYIFYYGPDTSDNPNIRVEF